MATITNGEAGSSVRSKINSTGVKLHKFDATTAPTTGDDSGDGYEVGSHWFDVTAGVLYACVDATLTAAVWKEVITATDLDALSTKAAPVLADSFVVIDSQDSDEAKTMKVSAVVRTLHGEVVELEVFAPATNVATGDGAAYVYLPAKVNGWDLSAVFIGHITAGTGTGTTTVQIRNHTDSQDMLSTRVTIDPTETTSLTAAAAVVDATHDDVATGDLIRIDVDAIPNGTAPKGLYVVMTFIPPAS
jgi:hypothetical protein